MTARTEDARLRSAQVSSLLDGVTVLEVSTRVSGAYCGHLLALLGADVTRVAGRIEADASPGQLDALLASLHRGKEEIDASSSVDFVESAQLVVIDVDPREEVANDVRALSEAVRRAANGVCKIVDLADFVTTEADSATRYIRQTSLTASSISGMSWAIGSPGREPLSLPYDLPDYLAGSEGAAAACALLLGDSMSSAVNATSTIANYVGQICSNFVPYGRPWQRSGPSASMSGGSYPAAMFQCSDGHVSIMCRTNREWEALKDAMGRPEWTLAPGFDDARVVAREHSAIADVHLSAWVGAHTRAEMLELSEKFAFPVAPVLGTAEALESRAIAPSEKLRPSADGAGKEFGAPWDMTALTDAAAAVSQRSWQPQNVPGQPLAGLRVLDLSWVWAGPMVTGILRDLGADVIKVESRTHPDPSRIRDGALVDGRPAPGPSLETSAYFNQLNSGKRSVAIDIATPEGRDLVLSLAAQVDVVVENMRPGALTRRGLDYAALSAVNPGLVMLSMSIFGHTSSLARVGGYAPVMSGYSGLDAVVGYGADDLIGLFNPALGDPIGASHATTGLLAALNRRVRTGEGAWVDVSQVEAMFSILRRNALDSAASPVPGNRHNTWPLQDILRCSGPDSWLAVSVVNDAQRARLAEHLSVGGGEDLHEAVAAWASELSAEAAEDILRSLGIAATAVNSFEQLRDTGWHKHRGLVSLAEQHHLPNQTIFHTPWTIDGFELTRSTEAPLLGQHTTQVLVDVLGLSTDDIDRLGEAGVVELAARGIAAAV